MLSELCVRRPVFATMLVMSLVVLGTVSFQGLGVDLFDAGAGADRLRSADRRAETVRCGAGADRLLADAADRPAGCEAIRLR